MPNSKAHAPGGNPSTVHIHNVKLSTGYQIINVKTKSAEIHISNALNDALVD
jgi:hypothetical protein